MIKVDVMKDKKIRDILRQFLNESNQETYREEYIPHIGNDENCVLCKIEKKYIRKLRGKCNEM